MNTSPSPRLYLDIDGVILADKPRFREVRDYDWTQYAPEVLRRLGASGLELVWLTTWGQSDINNLARDLGHAGSLQSLQRTDYQDDWKLRAVIHDQLETPAPFVWVDDHISAEDIIRLDNNVRETHLVVSPDPANGLTKAHLTRIEAFAAAYTSKALSHTVAGS